MINLVVGNLPPAVSLPQLTSFFTAYGVVEQVRQGRNHVTGRNERFCFLDLSEDPGGLRRLGLAKLWGYKLTVGQAQSPSGWAIG